MVSGNPARCGPARGSCSFRCPAHSGCLNNWLCSWDETEAQVSTPGLKPLRVPRFTEEQVCRPWAASPHLRAAAAPGAPLVSAARLPASWDLGAWGPSALAGCWEACCLRRSGRGCEVRRQEGKQGVGGGQGQRWGPWAAGAPAEHSPACRWATCSQPAPQEGPRLGGDPASKSSRQPPMWRRLCAVPPPNQPEGQPPCLGDRPRLWPHHVPTRDSLLRSRPSEAWGCQCSQLLSGGHTGWDLGRRDPEPRPVLPAAPLRWPSEVQG